VVRCAWAGNATCAITESAMNQIIVCRMLQALSRCELCE
jgi:hypothetical protein